MNFRERAASVNWSRKLWHLTGGMVIIALAYFLPTPYPFFIALASFFTWVSIESMRRRERWFGRLFFSLSAPFVRGFERRKILGNTWTAFAATILTALFHDPVLLAGAFVGWAFGDPAAEIIGKIVPSKSYFGNEKSVAGTIGCFAVGAIAYAGFFWLLGFEANVMPAAMTVAAAVTLAESFSTSFTINDNFLIPLSSALALSYILV